jgi:DNA-binding MarR family transcriptional regulator
MSKNALRLDDFLPYRLSVTSNLVSDRIAQSYRALFGLTIPEWRMIAVLAEQPHAMQQEIGLRTRMDKVTISRAAIALAARKLIARTPNPADGRSHCLVLTAAGTELYARIAPKAREMEREIFGDFPQDSLRAFDTMLRAIEARVAGPEAL